MEFDSNLTKLYNALRGTSIAIGNNITLNPAAADGRVEIEGEFYLRPQISPTLPTTLLQPPVEHRRSGLPLCSQPMIRVS